MRGGAIGSGKIGCALADHRPEPGDAAVSMRETRASLLLHGDDEAAR